MRHADDIKLLLRCLRFADYRRARAYRSGLAHRAEHITAQAKRFESRILRLVERLEGKAITHARSDCCEAIIECCKCRNECGAVQGEYNLYGEKP